MNGKTFGDETRESLSDLVDTLRRERDHLAVQLNLGKMEVRDEWESLESRWEKLEGRMSQLGDEAKHSATELCHELKEAYHRLRNTLK